MKRRIAFLFFLSLSVLGIPRAYLLGQQDPLSPYELSIQTFSPQVDGMRRFGMPASPLNRGQVNLEIPLINYQDRNFSFPIGLRYDSQGFKPADFGNFVGLGWLLSGGGVIYREIMGIPDDTYAYWYEDKERVKGFLHLCTQSRNPDFTPMVQKNEILKSPDKYLQVLPWSNVAVIRGTDSIEASSDIYHFRFGTHAGKFVIGYDGRVNVVSHNGGHYKVDLSEYHFSFSVLEGGTRKIPSISIVTDDGYTYTFGGTYAALEYMAASWMTAADIVPDYERTQRITAFHLTQITAPNGRTLNVSYTNPFKDDFYHNFPDRLLTEDVEKLTNRNIHHNYVLNVSPFQYFAEAFKGQSNDLPIRSELLTYKKHVLSKTALISSIQTDVGSIRFYYGNREQTLFDSDENTPFGAACGVKLDSLVFRAYGEDKQCIRFSYEYGGGRMLLHTVYDSHIGLYEFSYNHTPFVDPFTIDIDHWGYWSGNQSNRVLFPDLDYTELSYWTGGPFTRYRSENRKPTGREFNAFLLESIRYPTGGYTQYVYEPHDYERYIDQLPTNYSLELYGAISGNQKGKPAGGARLKTLISHSGNSPKQTITYQYTEGIQTQRSSGILLKRKPLYIYGISADPTIPCDNPIISYRSDGHQSPADYADEYISYSRILELYSEIRDSSKTIQINPQNAVRQKAGTLSFASSNDKDIRNCIMEIRGTGSIEKPATVTLHIHGSNRTEKKTIHFTSSIIEDVENGKVVVALSDEYGEGTVDFHMDAQEEEFLRLDMNMTVYGKSERGYKEYVFSDFDSSPDYVYPTFLSTEHLLRNPDDFRFLALYGKKVFDRSQERGLLLAENFYGKDGKLVKSVRHRYERKNESNYESSTFSHAIPYATYDHGWGIKAQFGTIHQVFKIPLYTYVPKENITVTYGSDSSQRIPFITQELLVHDSYGYLKKRKKMLRTFPDTVSYIAEYRYAFEEKGETYDFMRTSQQLSPVTQIHSYRSDRQSQEGTVVRNHYGLISALPYNAVASLCKQAVVSSVESGNSQYTLEERVRHLKFDDYGNLVYLIKDSLIHNVYLWSYKGQYPIAHIEGATYDEVQTALGNVRPELLSGQDYPDEQLLAQLHTKLPSAQVYIFLYKPFTGMIRKTAPDGQVIFFSYDTHNRLEEVYRLGENGEKEIIEHYRYSFK